MLKVGANLSIPLDEFDLSFARSSGPGGQNVNKVNSKAVLYWTISTSPSVPPGVKQRFMAKYGKRLTTEGVLVLTCDEHRDQRRNIDGCMEKLADMLREVLVPPKPRRPTKPSRGSV